MVLSLLLSLLLLLLLLLLLAVVVVVAAAAAAAVAVKMISKPFRLKFKILDIQHPFVSSCFVALVSTFP